MDRPGNLLVNIGPQAMEAALAGVATKHDVVH
jgi:hypothetical protein